MKENLVNLLYEEYKQIVLFEELEKKGICMNDILVNNSKIVFDIIGFPKEGLAVVGKNDVKGINRDWVLDKFYETIKGLKGDEGLIKKNLLDYINWLYAEYSNLNQ